MATLAYQFTDESDRKDGTKYRKYHLRSRVTVNGVYESFEHGKYFMEFTDRPNSDSKGVLKAICAIDGVYSAEAEFNSRPPVVKRLRELMQEETELLDEPFNVCKCENGLALLIDRDTAIAEIHDFFEALTPRSGTDSVCRLFRRKLYDQKRHRGTSRAHTATKNYVEVDA